MNKRVDSHKSSIRNYDANVLSFAIYFIVMIASFIPFLNYIVFALPLIIYVMEKKSDFVRSNSLQAFVVSLFSSIFSLMCLLVSFVAKPRCNESLSFCFGSSIIHKMFSMFGSVRWMFSGFIFVICLVLALRAYNYEEYKLNYVGGFIDKVARFLNRLLGVVPIGGKEETYEEIVEEETQTPVEEEIVVEDVVTSAPNEEVSIKDIVDYETPEEKDLKERARINKFLSLFKKKEKTNRDTKKEKFNKKKKLRKRKKNKRKVKKYMGLVAQKIKSLFAKKEKVVKETIKKENVPKEKKKTNMEKLKLSFKKKDDESNKKDEEEPKKVTEKEVIPVRTNKKANKKKTTQKNTKKNTTSKSGSSRKQKIKNKIKKIQ